MEKRLNLAKGRMVYVPPKVLDEIDMIGVEEGIHRQCAKFDKLVDFSRLGREKRKR
jgi:hypothetical protein